MKREIYYEKIVGYVVTRFTTGDKVIATFPITAHANGDFETIKLEEDQEIIGMIPAHDDYQVWGMFKDGDEQLGLQYGKSKIKNWNAEYDRIAKTQAKKASKK
jgi:hypothetical protein